MAGHYLLTKLAGMKEAVPQMNNKNDMKKSLCLLLFILTMAAGAKGQNFAAKTNLLYDATLTASAGVEIGLAPKWSLDLSGGYNAWTVNDRKWKHWLAQPEARYWFCDWFAGHFVGIHALGGQYNMMNLPLDFKWLGRDFSELRNNRNQGWFVGGGVAYGYSWILGRHWNLETEIGVGYAYTEYDVFECEVCGRKIKENVPYHYVGLTKAAINLVYVF